MDALTTNHVRTHSCFSDARISRHSLQHRVFFLEIPSQKIMERLTLQGLDPLTGMNYHMIRNPPENEKIKNRLEVHPHNTLG